MSEGMESTAYLSDAGALFRCAEGPLDTVAAHGLRGGSALCLIAPGGGKAPGRVPVGSPGGPEQRQGLVGQGDVPVCGARASVDMDLEALAVKVRDLKREGFVEPESEAIDGGESDLIGQGCGSLEQLPDFCNTEDGWETVCGLRANQSQGMPVAFEDVLREKSDTTGAETHGSWSEAIDVFAVQEGGLKLWFRDHVWGCARALSQHAYCTDRGLWGPCALATVLESSNHLLTPWGQESSPFLNGRVVSGKRKTS